MDWLSTHQDAVILAVVSAVVGVVIAWLSGFFRWFLSLFRAKPADPSSIAEGIDVLARRLVDQSTELGAARERERSYQDTITAQESEIGALSSAIEALEKQKGDPDLNQRRDKALALLRVGDTSAAEEIFKEILEAKSAAGDGANREAAEAARHLGALSFLHDTQKAIVAYTRATKLDPKEPDAWNQLGHLRLRTGELATAQVAYERVLALGNRIADKVVVAAATGNLGRIYQNRGDLDKAEAFCEKSLALYEAVDLKEGMASVTGNLGLIFQLRGDLDKAEVFHEKALALHEALGHKEGMASQYGNLGLVHSSRGDLNKAETFHEKALAVDETLDHKEGMAADYGNLGVIHLRLGDLDKAEALLEKALTIDKALGHKEGVANAYGNLGHIRKEQGDSEATCALWAKALELFVEIGAADRVAQMSDMMRDAGCGTLTTPDGKAQPRG